MTRELMDDAQAVAEVCALGSQIEKGLIEAEKAAYTETSEEAEAALRAWVTAPCGGHDPEFEAVYLAEVSRLPPIYDIENRVSTKCVLSTDGFSEK